MENSYLTHFQTSPFPALLLRPNKEAVYTIMAANPAFLSLLRLEKDDVVGKDYIESFYASREDQLHLSAAVLKNSLEYVRIFKTPRKIEKFHFSMQAEDGLLEEFAWEIENIPILNEDVEIEFILQMAKEIRLEDKPTMHLSGI